MIDVRVKRIPKLCNLAIGDLIRLPRTHAQTTDASSGAREKSASILLEDGNAIYMVCANGATGQRAHVNVMFGLYREDRPLFLVDIRTGEARQIPHLSTRVARVNKATLTVEIDDDGLDTEIETSLGNG